MLALWSWCPPEDTRGSLHIISAVQAAVPGLWEWDGAGVSPVLPPGGYSHPGHPTQLPQAQLESEDCAWLGWSRQLPAAARAQGFEGLCALHTVSLAARPISTHSHGMPQANLEPGERPFLGAAHRWAGCSAGLSCDRRASLWPGFSPSFCSSAEMKVVLEVFDHPSKCYHTLLEQLFG